VLFVEDGVVPGASAWVHTVTAQESTAVAATMAKPAA
jgi:hypothetical protein